MPRSAVKHGLDELEEDIPFQRRFWLIQRGAWAVFALLLGLAIFGFTGGGGVAAHGEAAIADGSVEYPRVSRWQGVDDLIVRLDAGADAALVVELNSNFVEAFEVTGVQPEPSSAAVTARGVSYEFDVQGGGLVVFRLRPTRPAFFPDAAVRVGTAEVRFRPLILP
jgi:hypothetical protein